jgi:hypothetical protein
VQDARIKVQFLIFVDKNFLARRAERTDPPEVAHEISFSMHAALNAF